MISSVDLILSFLTVAAQIFLVCAVLFVLYSYSKAQKIVQKYLTGLRALRCAFVVASVATLGSLFYSQIAGFAACELCWLQRIFMYPQVFLLGLALYKKDDTIVDYSLALAAVGTIISLYHNFLVYGVTNEGACSVSGVSCAVKYVVGFGYITIPLMALTAFLCIIFLLVAQKFAKKA